MLNLLTEELLSSVMDPIRVNLTYKMQFVSWPTNQDWNQFSMEIKVEKVWIETPELTIMWGGPHQLEWFTKDGFILGDDSLQSNLE